MHVFASVISAWLSYIYKEKKLMQEKRCLFQEFDTNKHIVAWTLTKLLDKIQFKEDKE